MGKRKIFLIVGFLILASSIPAGILILKQQAIFRLGAQDPSRPENVQVTGITNAQATVSWTTQKATQSLVGYGLSPSNLSLIQPETVPAINHQIKLERLLSGSNYFFVIKGGEKTFDDNGQPYTFTTQARETTPTPPLSTLTEEGLEAAMGTNSPPYDLNNDGVVNTLDLLILRQH